MISKTRWTDAYKTAWDDAVAGNRRFLANVAFYDSDGNETTTADDSNITELTVTQNLYDSPGIGFCSSAQMDMRFIPRMDASGDPILPESGDIAILSIRPDGTATDTRMGRFIVRACSYDVYTALATISCTDIITAFGENTISISSGTHTMNEYLAACATSMKFAFDYFHYVPNSSSYTLWHSELFHNKMCREALSLIAAACGCNCISRRSGFLSFVGINDEHAISDGSAINPVNIGKVAERITLGKPVLLNPHLHAAKHPDQDDTPAQTVDTNDYYVSLFDQHSNVYVYHADTYNPHDFWLWIYNKSMEHPYTPFNAERILMDPCVEIGDAVTIPYGSIPAWKGGSGTDSVTGQLSRIVTDYRTPQFSDIECAFPR